MPLFGNKKEKTFRFRKKDLPKGLWSKCPQCKEIIYTHDLERHNWVCPKCSFHFRINWKQRLDSLIEENSFEEWDANVTSKDPLNFTGPAAYIDKLENNKKKTGMKDAIVCGQAKINDFSIALGIMDFAFLGGSMGSAVGEKVCRLVEKATQKKLPLIIVSTSGGARMSEGIYSLMQMAKTSAALAGHSQANLPYISVLTHPTTAGVMASFATLGDIIIAEPNALIGFAGPRVIRETTRETIPDGFQKSEFVLKHGLIDMITDRNNLKNTLSTILSYLSSQTSDKAASV
jgi:acetyl-CoA carboxylase carboxyl transferase subunit beta